MRGHRDLIRASAAAVLCALVAALVPWEPIRIVAALPLALFLPGYAITAVAFAKQELARPKQLTLSFGISLMALALSALFINIFSFGLTTASWAVLLPIVVIAACRGAALRRGRPQSQSRRSRSRPQLRLSAAGWVALAAAALIVVASLVLAQKPLPAENAEGFTALWMLPTDSRDEAVRVGVVSSEQDPASYRLQVKAGKGRPQTYRVALEPGEEKTYEFPVAAALSGRTHVVASLYRSDRPAHLYRRVTSWLPRQTTFP